MTLMDLWRSSYAVGIAEEGLYRPRVEPVGALTELAGDGHRALLAENVPYLLLTECTQESRHPPLTAAALEMHR